MCKGVSWEVVAQQAKAAKRRDALQNSIVKMIDEMAPESKLQSLVTNQDAGSKVDPAFMEVSGGLTHVQSIMTTTVDETAIRTPVSWQLAAQQLLEAQQRDALQKSIVTMIDELAPNTTTSSAVLGQTTNEEAELECLDVIGGLAHVVPPIQPTTVDSWNRHRDQARIHANLGIPEQGDAHTMIVDPKQPGTVVGWGYLRVLYGDHGPYLELHHHQVCWASFPKVKRKCAKAYYDEHYTVSGSIKLYEQRRPVTDKPNPPGGEWSCRNNRPGGYADYRSGLVYVSADAVRAVEEWQWRVAAVSGAALHDVLGTLVWPKSKSTPQGCQGKRRDPSKARGGCRRRGGRNAYTYKNDGRGHCEDDQARKRFSGGHAGRPRSPHRPSHLKPRRGRSHSRSPCSIKLKSNTHKYDRDRSVSTTASTRSRSPLRRGR
mmetsp:Transcript_35230/g.64368  ORF Transcript_35230/g.64368 Transcript_35230/m.64368 type:complete len:431 (-) Transcript_35230:275-1567(-)